MRGNAPAFGAGPYVYASPRLGRTSASACYECIGTGKRRTVHAIMLTAARHSVAVAHGGDEPEHRTCWSQGMTDLLMTATRSPHRSALRPALERITRTARRSGVDDRRGCQHSEAGAHPDRGRPVRRDQHARSVGALQPCQHPGTGHHRRGLGPTWRSTPISPPRTPSARPASTARSTGG